MKRTGSNQGSAQGKTISRRTAFALAGAAGLAMLAPGCSNGTASDAQSDAPTGPVDSASDGAKWLYSPAGVTADGTSVDSRLVTTMHSDGIERPSRAGEFTGKTESFTPESDLYAEVNDLFYQRGWTDGLPIVPPIEENMILMAKGTDRPRQDEVATLAPIGGVATVEKIAANAVMAGCKPAYLPLVIAATEAIADSAFDLVSTSTTTSPNATLVLVNGPIAKEVGFNCGANALGRGWNANATVGRAVHLIEQNIGGSWPRVSDYSTLGIPADYSMAFAENETESPWAPVHADRGFGQDQNVVTVASAEGMELIVDIGVDAEGFLQRVADRIVGRNELRKHLLLVLTPSTAQQLAGAGFDKTGIRDYLNARSRVPQSRLDRGFVDFAPDSAAAEDAAESVGEGPDSEGLVYAPFIETLDVVVAGGVGEKNELIPLWQAPVSREVTLPKNWERLVAGLQG